MRKVVFAKFSKERREEYQIMTQVMEGNPRRLLKKAASPKAVGHIQKLEASCRILLEEYKDNKEVIICPCSLVEEGTAEFSYIEGESMEERLEKCINQQDWEGLLEEIKLLERIVSGVRHAGEFVRTDSFDAIFGEVRLPEGMRAGAVSNVDIIPTNLIFRNQYYMIDYEWVFDFPVPFSFILFRALFHSVEISKLPREMIPCIFQRKNEGCIWKWRFHSSVISQGNTQSWGNCIGEWIVSAICCGNWILRMYSPEYV